MSFTMKAPSLQLLKALSRSLFIEPSCARQRLHHARKPLYTNHRRSFSTTLHPHYAKAPSPTRSRGPRSSEPTQTDFPTMDVLGNMPPPMTAIDACLSDGFHLDNGVKITDGAGVLLAGGEAFAWTPWLGSGDGTSDGKRGMINKKGQWEVSEDSWGVLDLMWPKPDLLILGLGASMHPVSPVTRRRINEMGIRVDIQDTRNAAAQFNLLATERGVSTIAAALIPIGWKGQT